MVSIAPSLCSSCSQMGSLDGHPERVPLDQHLRSEIVATDPEPTPWVHTL